MFKFAGIALSLLSVTATLAWAQVPLSGTEAASASRTSMPVTPKAAAPIGQSAAGVPGGSVLQSGRIVGADNETRDQTAVRKGKGYIAGNNGNARQASDPPVSAERGKPSKEQRAIVSPGTDPSGNKSFFESRSNTARTDEPASTDQTTVRKGKGYISGGGGNARVVGGDKGKEASVTAPSPPSRGQAGVTPMGTGAPAATAPPELPGASRSIFKD